MPTATLINGKTEFGAGSPTLNLRPVGSTGIRDYFIDTPDIEAAATATGLPTFGTSWGGSLATLTVQNIAIVPIIQHGGDTPHGRCWARLNYEAPGLVNSTQYGFPGLKYSRVSSQVTGQKIIADIRLTSSNSTTVNTLTDPLDGQTIQEAYGTQIDNGRGIIIDVGYTEVEITRFMDYTDMTSSLWDKLEAFQAYQLTNDASVTIPTIVGTTLTRTYAARRLRMVQFEVGGDTAVTRLTMRFLAAPFDHDYRWHLTDEFNRVLPDSFRQRSRRYGVGSFLSSPALW